MTVKAPSPTRICSPITTLLGIIMRPRRTLTNLSTAKRRCWWLPLLLMLVGLALHGIFYSRANTELMYQNQLDWFESMPEQDRGAMAELPPKTDPHPLMVWLPIGGRVIGTLVTWVAWAGLIALASTFLGHNGAKFGGYFAMIAWTRLPVTIRAIAQGITMAVTNRAIYNQGLSGLVLDSTPAPITNFYQPGIPSARGEQILAALLGRVDIYMVWSLILTVIGVWAFGHLPQRRAVLLTLSIWIIATAISLVPVLLGIGQGTGIF